MANGFGIMGDTIVSHPIFVGTILPFVLVFTIVFAVLQKSKIFGEDKKQIDSIIGLVFGLLVVSFAHAVGIIIQLVGFLAICLVVVLVFMLLVGSFTEKELKLPGPLKTVLLIITSVVVLVALIYFSGLWSAMMNALFVAGSTGVLANVVFIIVIVGAIIAVILGSKAKKDKD